MGPETQKGEVKLKPQGKEYNGQQGERQKLTPELLPLRSLYSATFPIKYKSVQGERVMTTTNKTSLCSRARRTSSSLDRREQPG